jgi:hypothetical protein
MAMLTATGIITTGLWRSRWKKKGKDRPRIEKGIIHGKTQNMENEKKQSFMNQQRTQLQEIKETSLQRNRQSNQRHVEEVKGNLSYQLRTEGLEEPMKERGYTHEECAPEKSRAC